MKFLSILAASLVCAGVFVFYRDHSAPRFNPADWFEPVYPDQKSSPRLLALGVTHTKNAQDRAINNLSISIARYSDKFVSIKFAAIHDQTFYFPREVVTALQGYVARFRELRRRVAAEYRPDYREEIGLLNVLDAQFQPRPVHIFFARTPRYFRTRNGTTETKDVIFLMQLSFPFPLEATQQFDSTEISLDEAGVAKLKSVLDHLKQEYDRTLKLTEA